MKRPTDDRGFRRGREAGFTLVETLFAMIFLAIGLLAVAQMIPLASSHIASARNYTTAQEAAETTLEDLKALPFNDASLAAGDHTLTVDGRTVAYTVTDGVPVAGTKRIDLTVTWTESRGTKTLSFTTLLTR